MLTASASATVLWDNIQNKVLNPLIYLLFIATVIFFVFGVVEFLFGAEDPKKREVGKQHMIWGVVGMAIMGGAIGIVNILINTLY